MNFVTLFTDASWNRATSLGVWASWAKYNGNTIRHSGILKSPMAQICTAELAAIANGLQCVASCFGPLPCAKIIVQTDCLEAIHAFRNGRHVREADTAIISHINGFWQERGWVLDLRHVKGHKGTATPRNAVNTWCDRECKRQMGLALAKPFAVVIPFPTQPTQTWSTTKADYNGRDPDKVEFDMNLQAARGYPDNV